MLKPRYRYNWLRGWVTVDGFKWYVRGTNFSMHHEDWLRKEVDLSGDLFVDVGAHIGTWAIRASRTFKRVVAFEAVTKWSMTLQKNAEANSIHNIETHNVTISSNESGKNIRTLDSYALSPSMVKIDAEGSEYEVLKGAATTLKQSQPRLVIETHTDELAVSVKRLLKDYGLSVKEIVRVNRWGYSQHWLVTPHNQEPET